MVQIADLDRCSCHAGHGGRCGRVRGASAARPRSDRGEGPPSNLRPCRTGPGWDRRAWPRMKIDPGLEVAVDAFVDAVGRALIQATAPLPDQDPRALERSTVTEAFNLSCGFIDADGLATDDELWALIGAFGRRMGPDFARATPDDLRADGTTTGKAHWLASTSDLFEILLGVDRRNHTDLATTYYEHALAVAHMVASLDTHTGRNELLAIDAYRALLLSAIKGPPRRPRSATAEPGHAASPPASPDGRSAGAGRRRHRNPATTGRRRPLDELLGELDDLVGLAEVKREVKLVTDLLQVQRLRRERGLPVAESSRHLIFTGNPGTGQDHRRPPAGPDLPHPRRGQPRPSGRDRPGRPGGRLRRPDRDPGHRGVRPGRPGRPAHRRGLRPGAGLGHRLRPRGHRHHRQAGGGPTRAAGGDRRRLPRRDGRLRGGQPRAAVALPPHHRLPRLRRRRADRHLRQLCADNGYTCAPDATAASRAWFAAPASGQGLRQRSAGPQPVRAGHRAPGRSGRGHDRAHRRPAHRPAPRRHRRGPREAPAGRWWRPWP